MNAYNLNLKLLANLITVGNFEQLCQLNLDLKLETNHQRELIIERINYYVSFGLCNRKKPCRSANSITAAGRNISFGTIY